MEKKRGSRRLGNKSLPLPFYIRASHWAARDFIVKDFDGNDVKLSDYFGKPIVLNFWAYWCGPCQKEMPEFNAKYEELGGEVVFLMVHADPDTAKGKELVETGGYTFPVVFDETYQAAATYGIRAYPTTFFIDSEGNLQGYHAGIMSAELLQIGIDRIYTTGDWKYNQNLQNCSTCEKIMDV